MKFIFGVLFVTISSFVACAVALKNPECGDPQSKNGFVNKHGVAMSCMAWYPPLWSYNAEIKKCVTFRYGGCGGNRNSFPNKEVCEATCLE